MTAPTLVRPGSDEAPSELPVMISVRGISKLYVRGQEHNEVDTGQEEVNVIIEGSGVYEVDGEAIPVRAGSFLRFDPGTTRCPVAGPEGMTMIAVGVRPGSYEPHGPF